MTWTELQQQILDLKEQNSTLQDKVDMAKGCIAYLQEENQKLQQDNLLLYNDVCKLKQRLNRKGCDHCKGRAYTKRPLTVITKYGRRLEIVFEFCPVCGRPMKEGDQNG